MAALAAERGYALSCGRLGRGRGLSLFHVKLTDSALRAFEAYQGNKDSMALKPSIQFRGNQGHIAIPRPDCPSGVQTFSFYLSNIGKDSLQGSFDCIQQYVSSTGDIQLDCLGGVQDKITVCATDDSYQKAKQSMALAEEETRSRGAIVIKTGAQYRGKTVKVRRPAQGVSEAVPSRKHPTPVNLASAIVKKGNSAVSQRPLRDRALHLLALKPYKKPELLLRLQKDGLLAQEKEALDGVLQQVANVNAKDSTCTLKDGLYKEVQRDWPGYSEGDQQLLKRTLFRKLCQTQNAACPTEIPTSSPAIDNAPVSSSSSPPQKRPQTQEFTDPLASKKQRISHFAQRTFVNGRLKAANGPLAGDPASASPALDPARPHDPLADVSNDPSHGSGKDFEPAERSGPPARPDADADPSPAGRHNGGLYSKSRKKAKKHKDRERREERTLLPPPAPAARGKPDCGPGGEDEEETGAAAEAAGLNGICNDAGIPTSTSDIPDYLLNYGPISSSEQRQSYKADFNGEYSEYRDLHARIERITRHFMQLDAQLKQLTPGSDEYKTIHNQILQEYRKIKKTNPRYGQEKNRCEYLHNKLAHIKKLIAAFDHQQFQSWH